MGLGIPRGGLRQEAGGVRGINSREEAVYQALVVRRRLSAHPRAHIVTVHTDVAQRCCTQALRAELAEAHGFPLFRVAPNSLLVRLAVDRPASLAAFARVEGVNAERAELFGDAFLGALRVGALAAGLDLAPPDSGAAGAGPSTPSHASGSATGSANSDGGGDDGGPLPARVQALRTLPLMSLAEAAAAVEVTTTVAETWTLLFSQRKSLVDAASARGLVVGTLASHVLKGVECGLVIALQSPELLPGVAEAAAAGGPPAPPRLAHHRKCA